MKTHVEKTNSVTPVASSKSTSGRSGKSEPSVQRKVNQTGLPDPLKSGVENLSGHSLDDVNVHYNSDKPAQLQAYAFAQGTDIHVAPGQEKHLAHEAWHVVQQKQGKVKPTVQLKEGTQINDDPHLEKEADTMGAMAMQIQNTTQLMADTTARPAGPRLLGVIQMVNKEIGKNGVVDRLSVVAEIGTDNTLSWPSTADNANFSAQNYGGSVSRAMAWGLTGGEGTSGWLGREYPPTDFHNLANQAFAATRGLNQAPLNNESNKTLIAIRTFRASAGADMADKTLQDLQAVLQGVTNARVDLAAANLIANAGDNITEVKADPAEAHPGTLPTAKITFGGGETLYFKGRSGGVENALVGTNQSSATVMSQLGAAHAGDEVGTHTFVSQEHTHISGDVGAPAPHALPTDEETIRAWVSAARTAALVSLSGTGDLHESNVIDGASATKHIIDAEFLLDATAWEHYETASQNNEIPNFEIGNMAPKWVIDHTKTLSTIKKLQISDEVALRFRAMGLDNDDTLEQILGPIRELIANEALLRISPDPFNTAFWLNKIRDYHNEDDKDTFMGQRWGELLQIYPADYHIDLLNKVNVLARLRQNFEKGEVPLFHIGASTGAFYLDKDTLLGQVREDRSTEKFLELTKTAMINGYNNMVLQVRAAIVDLR